MSHFIKKAPKGHPVAYKNTRVWGRSQYPSRARYTFIYMHVSESELKDFIVDSGLVSRKDIDAALVEAKKRGLPLRDVLVGCDARCRGSAIYRIGTQKDRTQDFAALD